MYFILYFRIHPFPGVPKDFYIFASNDDNVYNDVNSNNWELLYTGYNANNSSVETQKQFDLPNNGTSYRYYQPRDKDVYTLPKGRVHIESFHPPNP